MNEPCNDIVIETKPPDNMLSNEDYYNEKFYKAREELNSRDFIYCVEDYGKAGEETAKFIYYNIYLPLVHLCKVYKQKFYSKNQRRLVAWFQGNHN